MSKTQIRQYTIRRVPERVDQALRRRAREQGKSFNEVALEALAEGAGVRREFHDLDFMIGTMTAADVRRMDRAVKLQRRIDLEMWK